MPTARTLGQRIERLLNNVWDSPHMVERAVEPLTWDEYIARLQDGTLLTTDLRPIGAVMREGRYYVVEHRIYDDLYGSGFSEEQWGQPSALSASCCVPVTLDGVFLGYRFEPVEVTYAPGWLDRTLAVRELPDVCRTTQDQARTARGYWVDGYPCPRCDEVPDEPTVQELAQIGVLNRRSRRRLRGDGPTIEYYGCCFNLCAADGWIAHPTTAEVCEECNMCLSHCPCRECPGCGDMVQSVCDSCEECNDCCSCAHCSRCERTYYYDDMCSECDRCTGCCQCDEILHSYDYIPDALEFYSVVDERLVVKTQNHAHYHDKAGAPDNEIYLGMEIETEAVDGEVEEIAQTWESSGLGYAKSDGSLDDGVECVTHPHTYEALRYRNLAQTLDKLRNVGARAWNTRTCGLHVHISRQAFTGRAHMWRFAAAVAAMERPLQKLAGRSNNTYSSWEVSEYCPKATKIVAGKANPGNRYVALNLQNEHTIECRFWKGSIQPRTVMGIAAFTDGFVRWTKNMTLKDVQSNLTWAAFCAWAANNLPEHQYEHISTWAAARGLSMTAETPEVVGSVAFSA